MRKTCFYYLFIPVFLFLWIPHGSAQSEDRRNTYTWFDKMTGSMDLRLVNGIKYIEGHRMINDRTKFFLSRDFLTGSVTYSGQTYFEVPLKINIYDDLLIAKLREGSNMVIFQLLNEKISDFTVRGHRFINIKKENASGLHGFYEIMAGEPELKLLKKHYKNLDQVLDEDFVYYEFFEAEPAYFLAYGNQYFPADSRRDILKMFPEEKKEIRKFFRNYKELRKENPERFMITLFNEILSDLTRHEKTLAE